MADSNSFFIENDIIRRIKSALGLSYPYKAGTVTLATRYYTKKEIHKVLKYCMDNRFPIEINYEKSTIKISGYCKEF